MRPHTNLTATPDVKGTKAAQHATAIALTNVTATASAKATASAIGNAQKIYKEYVDPNKSHISMDSKDQTQQWDRQYPCTFTNGIYQISKGIQGQYTPCMAHNVKPKNFAYQIQMTISRSGDAGGLILRADNGLMTFYGLSLDSRGMYKLYFCQTCADPSTSEGDSLVQVR